MIEYIRLKERVRGLSASNSLLDREFNDWCFLNSEGFWLMISLLLVACVLIL